MKVFQQIYDGESIVDLGRDISEALDERFNPVMCKVPADDMGFKRGNFIVTVEWRE